MQGRCAIQKLGAIQETRVHETRIQQTARFRKLRDSGNCTVSKITGFRIRVCQFSNQRFPVSRIRAFQFLESDVSESAFSSFLNQPVSRILVPESAFSVSESAFSSFLNQVFPVSESARFQFPNAWLTLVQGSNLGSGVLQFWTFKVYLSLALSLSLSLSPSLPPSLTHQNTISES